MSGRWDEKDFAALFLLLMLPQTACGAGWHRIDPQPSPALSTRRQVQVWHAGHVVRLHAVTVTADSLSGVPYFKPAECDSCRVTLARGTVDSVRSGSPSAGFWKTVGLSFAGLMAAALVICGASQTCQLEAD